MTFNKTVTVSCQRNICGCTIKLSAKVPAANLSEYKDVQESEHDDVFYAKINAKLVEDTYATGFMSISYPGERLTKRISLIPHDISTNDGGFLARRNDTIKQKLIKYFKQTKRKWIIAWYSKGRVLLDRMLENTQPDSHWTGRAVITYIQKHTLIEEHIVMTRETSHEGLCDAISEYGKYLRDNDEEIPGVIKAAQMLKRLENI